MGLRPLPPDDLSEDPELRANRIRSFYKEYFDDSKPNPQGQYPQHASYEDDHVADYYDNGAIYDPETGQFFTPQAPFAQPIGRRAMTPPPRGAAKFQKGHRSVASTQSAGRGRPFYPGSQPPTPKKRFMPPTALESIPTPSKLKENDFNFAPRTTYRDQQLGRGPDSPLGSMRSYSPAVPAHVPLATSYDDLGVMPSP